MKRTLSFLLSPVSSLAARLRRSRPGSVLIIVIVLLLLLAILGAAFISTTRTDRVASQQNVLNTDVDSTLTGISKICEGVLVDDLNDTFGNLRGNTAYTGNTTIVNRSMFQGEGQGTAGAPGVSPNVTNYNIGDVVSTTDDPSVFYYYYNSTSGTTVAAGTAITPVAPNANGTPSNGWQFMSGHLPVTALGSDPWIADRVPDSAGSGSPNWQYITQSFQLVPASGANPAYLAPASILGTPFVDPRTGAQITASLARPLAGNPGSAAILTPTSLPLGNGFNIPAFQYGAAAPIAAAGDADGDGIADCFMTSVPGMALDGLTWYVGVRIIDNNSAINANTAWSRDTESFYSGNTTNTWNLFQTSVGLAELINTSAGTPPPDSIATFNKYRFGNTATASQDPQDESAIYSNVPPTSFDRATGTKDYSFISQSEALYQQFIRRMSNPGYNVQNGARYLALPYSDEASLAYHFCLQNQSSLSQSVIETLLPKSLTSPQTSPYDPSNANGWYTANFQYGSGNSTLPIRPLLVTQNPASNYIQQVYNNNNGSAPNASSYAPVPATQPSISDPILPNYMLPYSGPTNPHFKGVWNPNATYGINDIVIYPGISGSPNYTFISVNAAANTGQQPANLTKGVITVPINSAYWQLQPWSVNPAKTNINTATFRELFRAFWCVMAGNPSNATPFGYTADDALVTGIYDDTAANPQHEFRSPLRDPTSVTPGTASTLDIPAAKQTNGTTTNTNTMLLRAAIAAVNTMGLRDNSQNITSKTIILKNAYIAGANTDVEVRVYSSAPQPFISEVYANTNIGTDPGSGAVNPGGYVAVELFNPYPIPLNLVNWTLAYTNRQTTVNSGTYPKLQLTTIGTIGTTASPVIIQPNGYLLIENCNYTGAPTTQPDTNAALARPADSGIQPPLGTSGPWTGPTAGSATTQPSPTGTLYQDIYMPFLETVIQGQTVVPPGQPTPSTGGELVLLRPRRGDGTLTQYTDPANANAAGSETYDEVNNTTDLVPVDSYDFTNLPIGTAAGYTVWSYIRAKGNDLNGNYRFKTTYPGTYNALAAGPRETGTYSQPCTPASPPTYAGGTPTPTTGTTQAPSTQPTTQPTSPVFGESSPGSGPYTNSFPPIQVYNVGVFASSAAGIFSSHFPNPPQAPNAITSGSGPPGTVVPNLATNSHPLGGFARNGDMLDIPFIGAYRIRVVDSTDTALPYGSTAFLEMNPVTKDCAMAAVNDATASIQNIGRFVPISATASYVAQLQAGSTNLPDYYAWSRNLFNYLTVQSSTDAYLPNFDPNLASSDSLTTPAVVPTFAYPPQNNATPVPPTPTLTADPTAIDPTRQDSVGIEGLININTASWKVLSMLPLVPGNVAQTEALAKAIVTYRLTHGPFMSIFDLNQVPNFQTAENTINVTVGSLTGTGTAPSSTLGLLSPADPGFGTTSTNSNAPLGTEEDYQDDCLELTRISNLITTRSDTFTVYIVLQGWQNVGTANAQPMVTRRYAFIVDRSAINTDPTSRYAKTLVVPNN